MKDDNKLREEKVKDVLRRRGELYIQDSLRMYSENSVIAIMSKYQHEFCDFHKSQMESEPFNGFYKRLKMFVSNVQVNDPMSEEEKDMIIHVCDKFLKSKTDKTE